MFCQNCGAQMGGAFCKSCGARATQTPPPPSPPPAQYAPAPPSPPPPAQYAPAPPQYAQPPYTQPLAPAAKGGSRIEDSTGRTGNLSAIRRSGCGRNHVRRAQGQAGHRVHNGSGPEQLLRAAPRAGSEIRCLRAADQGRPVADFSICPSIVPKAPASPPIPLANTTLPPHSSVGPTKRPRLLRKCRSPVNPEILTPIRKSRSLTWVI